MESELMKIAETIRIRNWNLDFDFQIKYRKQQRWWKAFLKYIESVDLFFSLEMTSIGLFILSKDLKKQSIFKSTLNWCHDFYHSSQLYLRTQDGAANIY